MHALTLEMAMQACQEVVVEVFCFSMLPLINTKNLSSCYLPFPLMDALSRNNSVLLLNLQKEKIHWLVQVVDVQQHCL